MKREIIIAMCLCVLSYFIGYESGYSEGANEIGAVAIEALNEVRDAAKAARVSATEIAPLAETITTGTSDLITTCAVIHADGRQCVSDGHGGYLPHD